jgi:hypothetical protein
MANPHWMLDTQGYKHTPAQYLTIIAFSLQHWLKEGA